MALTAHPVATLRRHATSFEAALTVCLAQPRVGAVHDLRSSTRRIEAQLLLLGLIPGIPSHHDPKRKLLKHLARLRHAAGSVRDLDIQRRLLAATFPHDPIAARLRERLKQQRAAAAEELVALIARRQRKTSAALETLLAALEPSANKGLPAATLLHLTQQWFDRQCAVHAGAPETEETLHTIRKAAKLARYLTQSAPGPAAAAAAARFERMQKAGGLWHDWLQLSQLPGIESHSALHDHIQRRIAAHLHSFRATLA